MTKPITPDMLPEAAIEAATAKEWHDRWPMLYERTRESELAITADNACRFLNTAIESGEAEMVHNPSGIMRPMLIIKLRDKP